MSVMDSMRPCHRRRDQTQPDFSSVRVALALLQLVKELLQMRREPGFGAKALLEPLAHGTQIERLVRRSICSLSLAERPAMMEFRVSK
jgi:hypothetical protein